MFAFVKYECSPRSCPLAVFVTAVEMRCCHQRQLEGECILACGHRGLDVYDGGGAEGSQRKQKRVSWKWGQPVILRACPSHIAAPGSLRVLPNSTASWVKAFRDMSGWRPFVIESSTVAMPCGVGSRTLKDIGKAMVNMTKWRSRVHTVANHTRLHPCFAFSPAHFLIPSYHPTVYACSYVQKHACCYCLFYSAKWLKKLCLLFSNFINSIEFILILLIFFLKNLISEL